VSDDALLALMRAIARGDRVAVGSLDPALVTATIEIGATRQDPQTFFLDEISHHIYKGDTALHIAAAASAADLVRALVLEGAAVGAVNRRGQHPLHYAADGRSASQRATVVTLLELGADPDAADKQGTTPLLRAIRNRCADAVDALIEGGADVHIANKSGSTARQLAEWTTGASGSGSPEARAEQARIIDLLRAAGAR
jgi:hypothetical protein